MIVIETPTRADPPITFHGYAIRAAGFTAETFAAAIQRALADGLTISPGRAPRTWHVRNPVSGHEYASNVHGCSCPASLHGAPCKHVAIVLLTETITTPVDRLGGASS
jgi:hypothetical protein